MASKGVSTGGGVGLVATIGGIVSMFNNPVVAEAGFAKGVFAHLLVGAGTGIGASAFGLVGALGAGAACFIAGGVLGRSSDAAKVGGAIGLIAGAFTGEVCGGLQGYDTSSRMLNDIVQSYKAAAVETTSRAASPVRLVQEGNKVVAYVPRAVLGR